MRRLWPWSGYSSGATNTKNVASDQKSSPDAIARLKIDEDAVEKTGEMTGPVGPVDPTTGPGREQPASDASGGPQPANGEYAGLRSAPAASGAAPEPASALAGLRQQMRHHRVGFYLVLEQDEHGSESLADPDRRVRYLSRFTGSAAVVSVGMDDAELATDSRYHLIAQRQLGPDWTLRKLGRPGVAPWDHALVARARRAGTDVGVDPRLIGAELAESLRAQLAAVGRKLVPLATNLVDAVWDADPAAPRPRLPSNPAYPLGLDHTGKPASEKLADLRRDMHHRGARTYASYSLEDTMWLLNIRGGDLPWVPVLKSFVVVTQDRVVLYAPRAKLARLMAGGLVNREGVPVFVKEYDQFFADLGRARGPVWVPDGGTWAMARAVGGGRLETAMSPINLRKAVKNCAEIAGMREAQLKCSLSIVRYLSWLETHVDDGVTEWEGGRHLLGFRQSLPDFVANSFDTISAAGPNAAAPHYAPTRDTAAVIGRNQVYLLDSGSHFLQGSTDITRTTHFGQPTADEIRAYTLVLKGQLAVSSCVFPAGTSGAQLDILARQFLWEAGLNYGHGTGHGIGSFLNIHELPLGIGMTAGPESVLVPGHFVSDEPGYYAEGRFGVRLENDILVVPSAVASDFYTFETLTVVPYEPRLIDRALLTAKEIAVINAYHGKCRDALEPHLKEEHERAWLDRCTAAIE